MTKYLTNIHESFRNGLQITFALLLGSDYSQGVYGMGRVGLNFLFARLDCCL